MWSQDLLSSGAGMQRWAPRREGAPLPHAAWLAALGTDAAARATLIEGLRAVPFAAFLWETPPLPVDGEGPPAEFVLVDSAALARSRPEPSAFAAAFAAADGAVATFANL